MLTAAIVIPFVTAVVMIGLGRLRETTTRAISIVAAAIPLVLLVISAIRFDPSSDAMFQLIEEVDWIPSIGVSWAVGVDGISLALAIMTALLFVAAIAYPVELLGRHAQYRRRSRR